MKKFFAVLGFFLASGVSAAPTFITNPSDFSLTGSTLINFESELQGSFTSRTFGNAVTVASSGTNPFYVSSFYGGSFGTTGTYIETQSTPDPINFGFASDVSAFGFSWGAADQPWTFDIFDSGNNLLASFNVPAQSGNYAGFIGVNGGGASIASARLTNHSSYGYDYVLIDNLQYVNDTASSSSVPEPTSIALLGLGLLGFAASRRKSAK